MNIIMQHIYNLVLKNGWKITRQGWLASNKKIISLSSGFLEDRWILKYIKYINKYKDLV